jgi:hypothetical protein
MMEWLVGLVTEFRTGAHEFLFDGQEGLGCTRRVNAPGRTEWY